MPKFVLWRNYLNNANKIGKIDYINENQWYWQYFGKILAKFQQNVGKINFANISKIFLGNIYHRTHITISKTRIRSCQIANPCLELARTCQKFDPHKFWTYFCCFLVLELRHCHRSLSVSSSPWTRRRGTRSGWSTPSTSSFDRWSSKTPRRLQIVQTKITLNDQLDF